MSTDIDIFRTRGVDVATDEKARRAVKVFRNLQPTLTAYARNLTGRKDVVVEMAAQDNGSTDGKKIYYRPPIALGEERRHERRSCDKRDPGTRELLCLACAVREEVLVTIYHEIGHIAFESFAEVSAADFLLTMEKAIEEVGTKYAKQIKKALDNAPYRIKTSYIGISNYVSPFLPFLVNCLEDARVNAEMFKARPGTKVMFDTSTTKIFREGVEQVDRATGEVIVKKWAEYPLNAQVSIGVFCIASGYSYEEWFAPQVIEALRDEKLNQLVRSIDTIRSAAGVYQLSFPVLARLRELGFCKSDRDPENEEEQDEPENGAGPEDSDSGDSEPADEAGPGDNDSEEAPQEEDSDASEGAGGSGSGDQEPGSDGDPDEDDSDTGGLGGSAGADSESEDSGAEGPEDDNSSDDTEGDDAGAGADDKGPSDGTGTDAGSSGSELDNNEGGSVDDSAEEAGTETGDRTESGSSSDELGGDSESAPGGSEADSDEDTSEAGEEAGITGTGDIEGGALDEGSGGRQAAESGGEDRESEDDDALGEPAGGDLAGGSEPGSESESEGDAPLGRDGSDSDEPADAGSAGSTPPDDDSDGDAATAAPGSSEVHDEEGDDAEPFDSGADDGTGGIDLIENKEYDDIPLGTPEEVEWALHKLGAHEEKPTSIEEQAAEQAVDRAIIQGLYFETPSRYIYGVREHRYGQPVIVEGYNTSQAWDTSGSSYMAMGFRRHQLGRDGDFSPNESVLGAALVRMRVAFSDNKRGSNERNLKAGKINTKVLGKRAWNNDERLFRKRTQPGKKDYFVVIGMDVSGSTVGRNIVLEKQAVMAQAELCKRMGIKFAIFAHSGNLHSPISGRSAGMDLDVYFIKEHNEPWDDKIKQRLTELGPDSSNLDGHFLEYLRKAVERVPATDKVILYYSDGKMPAENHDEELEILQREIRYCATRDITLLGVGIRTDSPVRHGLDTVRVDTDEDIVKVVRHLEKRLH